MNESVSIHRLTLLPVFTINSMKLSMQKEFEDDSNCNSPVYLL